MQIPVKSNVETKDHLARTVTYLVVSVLRYYNLISLQNEKNVRKVSAV